MAKEINEVNDHKRLTDILERMAPEELESQFHHDGIHFFKNNQGQSIGNITHNLGVDIVNAKQEIVCSLEEARRTVQAASDSSTAVAKKLNLLTAIVAISMILTILVSAFTSWVQYKQFKLNEGATQQTQTKGSSQPAGGAHVAPAAGAPSAHP